MKTYKTGTDREQLLLIQTSLDDKITSDNPVRVIDKIVDEMNVCSLGFKYSEIKKLGRTSYSPADMLKLYLYCYFFGIRSSRKMERECQINIELMWLIKELSPDHKTIANFRKDNKEAIEKSFKYFILLCSDLGLLGKELIAVDGSKFKANSSSDKHKSKKYVKEKIVNLKSQESQIKKYLDLLDKNDDDDDNNLPPSFNKNDLENKLKNIKDTIKKFEYLEKNEDSTKTDIDAKIMKSKRNMKLSYNIEAAVDAKHKIVVAVDTTNEVTDYKQLHNISSRAKNNLGVEKITVVADRGFYSTTEFKKCDDENIYPIVPKPLLKSSPDKNYSKDKFVYNFDNDSYTCPLGKTLSTTYTDNTKFKHYHNLKACKNCKAKSKCHSNTHRILKDFPYQNIAHIVDKRTKENRILTTKRMGMIENVFGSIKHDFGFYYFLTRRLENVATETFLHFLTYNLKRVINILGTVKILQSV